MENKKYQVFISSTYSDLIEERRKILDTLLMADCIPAGMEAFVATDDAVFEVIKKVIDLCDYYILIIGKRYGSVNDATNLSYTEMEYNYAIEQEIQVLVFAIDEAVELPQEKLEQNTDHAKRLKAFREKALSNRLASIWSSGDDLALKVLASIMKAKQELPRPGWQRATDFDEASLRREIMDLQKQRDELSEQFGEAKATIASFTAQTDVAFEDCSFTVDYSYTTYSGFTSSGHRKSQQHTSSVTVKLPEIFKVVAIEMLNAALTEDQVKSAVVRQLIRSGAYLTDDQIVKKILNQLANLSLISSRWSRGKVIPTSVQYWELTAKGIRLRDDMTLIRSK